MNNQNVIELKDYIKNPKEKINPFVESNISHTPKTNLGKRSIAFGVDIMAIMTLKMSITTSYAMFVNDFMVPLADKSKIVLINGNLSLNIALFICIYYTYFLFTNFILNGRSLGKLTMGLRVINEKFIQDKEALDFSLTLKETALRSLGYLICYLSFGSFFVFNFASEDKKGVADYLSQSRTVDEKWLKTYKEYKKYCLEEVIIDIYSLNQAA